MKILNTLLAVGLTASASVALANPFTVSTSGVFDNASGGANMVTTGTGTNVFTWGTPYGNSTSSQLNYAGGQTTQANEGVNFQIGSLYFKNGVINDGTGADNVDLNLSIDILSPITLSNAASFKLDLTNTQNNNNAASSSDTLTLANGAASSYSWVQNKVKYTFSFVGFGQNANSIDNFFTVEENQAVTTYLWGRIDSVVVPEPSSVALLGLGVLGLVGARRKKA